MYGIHKHTLFGPECDGSDFTTIAYITDILFFFYHSSLRHFLFPGKLSKLYLIWCERFLLTTHAARAAADHPSLVYHTHTRAFFDLVTYPLISVLSKK